jgi:phosphoglycolate phosphatase
LNNVTIGFDFDQTLADSKCGISSCLRELCKIFDVHSKENEIDRLAVSGLTLDFMLKSLFNIEEIELHRQKFLELYPSLGVEQTRLIPGAKKLLEHLVEQGHRLILISAKNQNNLDLSVRHLGLEFDAVFGGASSIDKTKIMLENKTYLYVGDQLSDVSAANAANAKAILVNKIPLEVDIFIYPHIYFKNLKELHNSISSLTSK